jgi:uncharacterized membrane protein
LTSRARSRRLAVAVGLAVALGIGGAAPASAGSAAPTRRSCPDGTRSVFDGPAPTDGGGFLFDDGEYRTFTRADAVAGSPTDINNRGDIIGGYSDTAGVQHGFRVDERGCFSLVEYPGGPRSLNEAIGVNDRRQVAGTWGEYGDERTNAEAHGYVRDKVRGKDRFRSIDVPGALVTSAFKNNNRGQVVGSYSNEARGRIGIADAHGFMFERGRFTRIDVPGADKTLLVDINDRRQILGVGMNADNTSGFGFVRDHRGRYTRLPDVPGSLATAPLGFNNRGQVVGFYSDADGAVHGFLLDEGHFTTLDVPGFATTMAWAINDKGQIVGGFANVPPLMAETSSTQAAPASMNPMELVEEMRQ